MRTRWLRLGAPLAIIAIIVAACGGATPSASPTGAAPSTASAAPTPAGPATVPPGGPVTIKWFCCLGGGDDPSTLKVFDEIIKEFNTSHPNIKLVFDHAAYSGARDAFATEMASGNGPDVVGPLGVGGANAFEGQWLDLSSMIQKSNVDLSGFDPGVVNLYKAGGWRPVRYPLRDLPLRALLPAGHVR